MSEQPEKLRMPKLVRTLIVMLFLVVFYFLLKAAVAQDADMFTETDRRLDAKQLQLFQAAKKALGKQQQQLDARYTFFHNQRGYSVTIWRVNGYDWLSNPQFVPGGFWTVDFDKNLKVVRVSGGY